MGLPADPLPGGPLALAGAGTPAYRQVRYSSNRGKDQPVTTGQPSTVTGTGHRAFPGPSGARSLLRRIGRIIEAARRRADHLVTLNGARVHYIVRDTNSGQPKMLVAASSLALPNRTLLIYV